MGSYSSEIEETGLCVARAMLVLEQYARLCRMAEGVCRIVPLKGVSLLQSVYSERLDRDAGDIDILVYPPQQAEKFASRLTDAGYERQFDYLADSNALMAKQKIAFKTRSRLETDIDVHLAFVTKKFFRRHCGDFNVDAMRRCVAVNQVESRMDPVDEWLFLAQHACFHQFENRKWIHDLERMIDRFSQADLNRLRRRARKYGFTRIVRAVARMSRCSNLIPLRGTGFTSMPTGGEARFDRMIDDILHAEHSGLISRVFKWFWEIMFIDSRYGRMREYVRIVFPSRGELKAVYRTASPVKAELLRVPHIVAATAGLAVLAGYRIIRYGFR